MNKNVNVKIKVIITLITFLGTTLLSYGNAGAKIDEDYLELVTPAMQASPIVLEREGEKNQTSPNRIHQEKARVGQKDAIDQSMEIFQLMILLPVMLFGGESNAEEKDKNRALNLEIEDTKEKIKELSKEIEANSGKTPDPIDPKVSDEIKLVHEVVKKFPFGDLLARSTMGNDYKRQIEEFIKQKESATQKILDSLKISDKTKTSIAQDIGDFITDAPPIMLPKVVLSGLDERKKLERQYEENKKTLEKAREVLKQLNIQRITQLQTQLDEKSQQIDQIIKQLPKAPSLNIEKEEQKLLIGANVSANGSNVKVAIIDNHFDPNRDTKDVLSSSSLQSYEGKDKETLAHNATELGLNHANYIASILHSIAPNTELRMIDLRNEPSLQDKEVGNIRVIAAIDEAIKSKVDFINISLRISPDSDKEKNSVISEEMKKAFLRAKEAGIGIIKSIGNDNEFIGHTPYTRSLAQLVEEMDGHMILVGATQYDADWQLEKLARYSGDQVLGGSNHAGIAFQHTLMAPGKNIYVGSKEEKQVTSGTSVATPLVAAAAALVKSVHPNVPAREVFGYLLQSARKYSCDGEGEIFAFLPAGKYGQGIVNVELALEMINKQKAEEGKN